MIQWFTAIIADIDLSIMPHQVFPFHIHNWDWNLSCKDIHVFTTSKVLILPTSHINIKTKNAQRMFVIHLLACIYIALTVLLFSYLSLQVRWDLIIELLKVLTPIDFFLCQGSPPSKYSQPKLYAEWVVFCNDVDIPEHDLAWEDRHTKGSCNRKETRTCRGHILCSAMYQTGLQYTRKVDSNICQMQQYCISCHTLVLGESNMYFWDSCSNGCSVHTQLYVSIFDKFVENGWQHKAKHSGVIVGEIDHPGYCCHNGDEQPVKRGLWQLFLQCLNNTDITPLVLPGHCH